MRLVGGADGEVKRETSCKEFNCGTVGSVYLQYYRYISCYVHIIPTVSRRFRRRRRKKSNGSIVAANSKPPPAAATLPIFVLCERKLLFVDIAVTIELMGKIDDDNERVDDVTDVAIATKPDAEETSKDGDAVEAVAET